VFYMPQRTSDNAIQNGAGGQLPHGGGNDVRETVADVVAVAGPQLRPVTTADNRNPVS